MMHRLEAAGSERRANTGSMLRVFAAVAMVFTIAGAWAIAGVAQQAPNVPARPLATAFATSGHDAFPLVSADVAGDVRIAISELVDHAVHHFTFMSGTRPVEFFAVWSDDNVIRTALNACDVCYRAKLGYRQDSANVVCNNCGNRFPIAKIATVTGGCNPVPLAARIDGQDLVIAAATLTAGLSYFP